MPTIFPLLNRPDEVLIAISDMRNLQIEWALKKYVAGRKVRYVLATPSDIQIAIQKHYGV